MPGFSFVPSASDDNYMVPHDHPLAISAHGVLSNDNNPLGGSMTAALVTGLSHGTLNLNSDGSFTYSPTGLYSGVDSFKYTASNSDGASGPATVYINVYNFGPSFTSYSETVPMEVVVNSSDPIFQTGQVLGQLTAYDPDTDPLVYSGSANFLTVLGSGLVKVSDGPGLSNYFDNGGTEIDMPVSVTDSIAVTTSHFKLKVGNIIPGQAQMSITTKGGASYTPTSKAELLQDLQAIQANGGIIDQMIIKGHGNEEAVQVGEGTDYLTAPTNGTSVYIGDTDATALLKAVTDSSSTITLRGCHTRPPRQACPSQP